MRVRVVGNLRAIELHAQLVLRAVEDHEVRAHRDDPLDRRVEQRADAGKLFDLRRKAIVAADGDQPIARTHREQHFRGRGNDGHDAPRLRVKSHRRRDDERRDCKRRPAD